MSKDRKTVSIDMLLDYANRYLASDYDGADSEDVMSRRQGVIDLIEDNLLAIGRYRGFSYLDDTVITKSKPGIHWTPDAKGHTFHNTDPTRRRYA